jgi:hypothetical protein
VRKQYAKRGKKGTKTLSADEVSLRRVMHMHPERTPFVKAVLRYRALAKQAESVAEGKASADGRMRGLYDLYASSGRLKCSEPPVGGGRNLQNVARGPLRDMFVPDEV